MRHFWTTVALVLGLAAGVWFGMFRSHCGGHAHDAARAGDALEWMRCEFHLTDAQFAEIRRLHEEQNVVCAGHCAAVAAAKAKIADGRQGRDETAVAAAKAELAQAEALCRASTEAHVRRVAAAMAPAEGARYLEMVLPRLQALDHAGPPSVTLEH